MSHWTPLVEENIQPAFGGHEKFVFRHGWLKKGVDALARNPSVFADDDAIVILGVGKNMVRSIRYWCLATGLFEQSPGQKGKRDLRLSNLARLLITDNGWDPYLENIGTLWLLHWRLATNVSKALIWYLTFCAFLEREFTKKQLNVFIERQLERLGISVTSATIEREVDVCLRTYVPATRKSAETLFDESLDCPLADLELLHLNNEDNIYQFNVGPKPSLPPAIFGYALLQFLGKISQTRRTVVVDECIYRAGSPGQVFKLDENSVIDYLEELEKQTNGCLRLQETAGLRQIYLQPSSDDWFDTTAFALLGHYYAQHAN